MRRVKLIVERHADGYVAYPLGLKGVVVGEGSTYKEALADVKSAIVFHLETFGAQVERGIEQFEAGKGIPLDEAEKRLRKKHGFREPGARG